MSDDGVVARFSGDFDLLNEQIQRPTKDGLDLSPKTCEQADSGADGGT